MRSPNALGAALLALGVLAAGTVWLLSSGGAADEQAGLASTWDLSHSAPVPGDASLTAKSLPPSGLSHSAPPPLEELRGNPARQDAYDAEAQPGEFVTPPAVAE